MKNVGQKSVNGLGEKKLLGASDQERTSVGPRYTAFQAKPKEINGRWILGVDGPNSAQKNSNGRLKVEVNN